MWLATCPKTIASGCFGPFATEDGSIAEEQNVAERRSD